MGNDTPMATKGTFADFRIIKTRKCAQLVIEVPIEEADAALSALGGLPRSDCERWVAVARLNHEGTTKPLDLKERRAFCDLPFVQQAGIMSNDLKFQFWMSDNYPEFAKNGGDMDGLMGRAAQAIRDYCRVSSRAQILPGTEAAERWLSLLREFEGYR
jgi:hypothetical protein